MGLRREYPRFHHKKARFVDVTKTDFRFAVRACLWSSRLQIIISGVELSWRIRSFSSEERVRWKCQRVDVFGVSAYRPVDGDDGGGWRDQDTDDADNGLEQGHRGSVQRRLQSHEPEAWSSHRQ